MNEVSICGAIEQRPDGPWICTLPEDHRLTWLDHHFERYEKVHRALYGRFQALDDQAGSLSPAEPEGPIGRVLTDTWRHARRAGARIEAPDGVRIETPLGGPIVDDIAGTASGKGEGRSMASINEIKFAIQAVEMGVENVQDLARGMVEKLNELRALTSSILQESQSQNVSAAMQGLAHMTERVEEAVGVGSGVIEYLSQYRNAI
jgi:hypothetical protein